MSTCQVAIERKETLFVEDPTQFPGLEKNEDYIKYGYGYYVGAPWIVGDTRGKFDGERGGWRWRERKRGGRGQRKCGMRGLLREG